MRRFYLIPKAWILCDESGTSLLSKPTFKERGRSAKMWINWQAQKISSHAAFFGTVLLPEDEYALWKKYLDYQVFVSVVSALQRAFVQSKKVDDFDVLVKHLRYDKSVINDAIHGQILTERSRLALELGSCLQLGAKGVEAIVSFNYHDVMALLERRIPDAFKNDENPFLDDSFVSVLKAVLSERPCSVTPNSITEALTTMTQERVLQWHLAYAYKAASLGDADVSNWGLNDEWKKLFMNGLPQVADCLKPSQTSEQAYNTFIQSLMFGKSMGSVVFEPGTHPKGLSGQCKTELKHASYLSKMAKGDNLYFNVIKAKMDDLKRNANIKTRDQRALETVQVFLPAEDKIITGIYLSYVQPGCMGGTFLITFFTPPLKSGSGCAVCLFSGPCNQRPTRVHGGCFFFELPFWQALAQEVVSLQKRSAKVLKALKAQMKTNQAKTNQIVKLPLFRQGSAWFKSTGLLRTLIAKFLQMMF